MKSISLSKACCTATPSNNTSPLHSATILNHTIIHVCSEAKHCYSSDDITGQQVPFFNVPPSWPVEKLSFMNFENS